MRYLFAFLLIVVIVVPSFALVITDGYSESVTLNDSEYLLMTGGGIGDLNLFYESSATIEGTSTLSEGSGGIWQLSLFGKSALDFSGGEVHQLNMNNCATAVLSGGLIEEIWSYQLTQNPECDHLQCTAEPRITIVYSGDLPCWDSMTNILTGLWGSGESFSIQLYDVPDYSPVMENIQLQLIPEPATLVLLGVGALLLKKRR